jgi:hypothetical protein
MRILYILLPQSEQFHPLGLFKDKHPKELKFSNIILWPSSIVSQGFSNNLMATTL